MGGGCEAAAWSLRQGKAEPLVGSLLPTDDVEPFRPRMPGRSEPKTCPGTLGFRGPIGSGGRDRTRVRAATDVSEELEGCRLR